MVVEISSPPGGGKTAVAVALAQSAATTGEVLVIGKYRGRDRTDIDTEGGITPRRVQYASGIHLVRIATQPQMVAFLHNLDDWLEQHPKVHLVVIDTLSYHFRQPNLEMGSRRRAMEL
jgi:RAD51-like protein 2